MAATMKHFRLAVAALLLISLSSCVLCVDLNLVSEVRNADEESSNDLSKETELETQEIPLTQTPIETITNNASLGSTKEANVSLPITFIHIAASYMRPVTFHRFLNDLNITVNASLKYPHPDVTYVEDEALYTPRKIRYPCLRRLFGNRTAEVRIVNSTELTEAVSFKTDKGSNSTTMLSGYCAFVMFFAPWCKFSTAAAPPFNAIGRAFPDLEVLAIDAFQHNSLNTRYSIVAVPNILLFHNNKPVMRFNYSERTFSVFTDFIRNFTGLEPNSSITVNEADAIGPLPSIPTEETDYALWFSWLFLAAVAGWFLKQHLGSFVMDRVRMFLVYARQVWRTGEFYDQVGVMAHEHRD
ncbi:uncharacterized protein LOC117303647 [Asterias rubens]|uniref:uncharacterized protein LOC117303647 n=1 Tax=Asterias rubens TaxID=7604 RepID=UPI0014556644|nr:uncharacterized protein LOC117303647 [Asterias rubens]